MKIAISAVLYVSLAMMMLGCTANEPIRTYFGPYDPTSPEHTRAVIEVQPGYKLGFVEFDDQGSFCKFEQRQAVEDMIRSEAGLDANATPRSVVVVVFVHGWKDNAADDDGALHAMRDTLAKLADFESASSAPRKIVGVYVGWRGLSATVEPFKEASFWSRKDIAHKVGGYGGLARLFVELEDIQKQSLAALGSDKPRTEMIIIGHSFGGAAIYSALSQIITERFVTATSNPDKPQLLKPLGDQIILLNPAFEAQRHWDLNEMATHIKTFPPNQRPVFSIFTSETDWATHYIFPLGQFFGTLFQANRNNEFDAGLSAVGWYEPFITHRLEYHDKYTNPPPAPVTQPTSTTATPDTVEAMTNIKNQRTKWQPGREVAQTYYFKNSLLAPTGNYRAGNPFLIVKVDKRIMNGHNDIEDPQLLQFLREYIQFCDFDPKDAGH